MSAEDNIDRTLKLQECLQNFIDRVESLRNEDDPTGDGFTREFKVRGRLKLTFDYQNTLNGSTWNCFNF